MEFTLGVLKSWFGDKKKDKNICSYLIEHRYNFEKCFNSFGSVVYGLPVAFE